MLAYAASRSAAGRRQSSPHTMLIVIGAHVALVAAVMSAKLDLPPRHHPGPITIIEVPRDPPPPPPNSAPQTRPTGPTAISQTTTNVPLPPLDPVRVDPGPVVAPGPIVGGGTVVTPIIPNPTVTPVHEGPRLLTPPFELKPPYPPSKIVTEEEAVLTLRLSIDEHGRVVSVEPVGHADREFLQSARRHLLAHWRYDPATVGGRAVESSITVVLRFTLDG